MSSSDLELAGTKLADQLESAGAVPLSAETRRRLFTALVRDFARRAAPDADSPEEVPSPIADGVLTTEEVAVTVAALMKAADVTSFEMAALFNV